MLHLHQEQEIICTHRIRSLRILTRRFAILASRQQMPAHQSYQKV